MGTAGNLAVAQLRQGGGRQPRHGRVESGLQSVVVSRPAQMVSGHAQLAGEKWASRRMCGIYGMVGADAEAVLPRMSAALVHRGPDGDGWAVRGAGGVGCRRLAIIDVAGGAQPLANETGDVIAVCNGEIYNHAALRAAGGSCWRATGWARSRSTTPPPPPASSSPRSRRPFSPRAAWGASRTGRRSPPTSAPATSR